MTDPQMTLADVEEAMRRIRAQITNAICDISRDRLEKTIGGYALACEKIIQANQVFGLLSVTASFMRAGKPPYPTLSELDEIAKTEAKQMQWGGHHDRRHS